HVQPVSILQSWLQPSPSFVLPSSHSSPGNFRPSPHTAVHEPPAHFGSMVHVGEQPSNGRRLPSSHCSLPSTTPSPHVVWWHTLPVPAQPVCTLHCASQPWFVPFCAPMSHCSLPAITPSPHCLATHGRPGFGHVQPISTWQLDEQPSLLLVLP